MINLVINNKSETPIYEQLYQQIVAQILAEKLRGNDCLPSIRVVARELQISVIPVKTAYEILEKDGYIYTVAGKGCFVCQLDVAEKKMTLAKMQLSNAVDYCKQLGLKGDDVKEIVNKLYN